ncbi:MAG: hypothetical protein FWD60_10605 [Candidatus Azobacteroides sp.]|nr:hypothetical protein [Candidatus Azobacteroides sp.]
MELEELKNAWTVLDNKLQKNEVLNERIVKEMLQIKTNNALRRLSNHEWMVTIMAFLGFPFLIFMYNNHLHEVNPKVFLLFKYLFIFCIISLVIHIPFQVWKLYTLMKIDFNKTVGENINLIQKYNIQIKRDKIYSGILFAIMAVVFFISIVIVNFPMKEIWRPIFIVCTFVFGALRSIWLYKKVYNANIQSIKKSLEELKELEEE